MTTRPHSLRDRVAIVTGAGKGLGRAYALHLASLGARVLVNNRCTNDPPGKASADQVVSEIHAAGGEAAANYDSVEHRDSGEKLVAAALEHFGRLDIVLSNAGIDRAGSFHKQSLEDFDAIMQINFHAVAQLLHAAWPHLREACYGRVVVSTSTAGLYGNHGQAAYSSSKAALLGLVKALSIEGASRGICVNAVAPYAVTQLTSPWFPEQNVKQFAPDSVAGLVGWLVSEQCELSGETLIAGAGHARRAQVLESGSVALGENPSAAALSLTGAPCNLPQESANSEFADFIQSLPIHIAKQP
jgi:NAD(P)-dependent dehydrogenase (short-subunit alcohol dehydrogenase family)